MTTATLFSSSHDVVQRSRFLNTAVSVVAGLFKAAPAAAPIRGAEAQAVRKMALSYSKTDPGFASDLYAAADRHELEMDSLAA